MIKLHIAIGEYEFAEIDYKTIDDFDSQYEEDVLSIKKKHYNSKLTWKKANEAKSPK